MSSKLQDHPDHPLHLSREICQGYSQEIERELGPCSQFVIRQIKQVLPSIAEAPSSYSYRLDHRVSWYQAAKKCTVYVCKASAGM
jgi:hypothetical protein